MGQSYAIILYKGTEKLWTLEGRFNYEFAIGALVAGEFALYILNDGNPTYQFKGRVGDEPEENPDVLIDRSGMRTQLARKADNFRASSYIVEACHRVKEGYNIWLNVYNQVDLYTFKDREFLRGIFTILRAFRLNYRGLIMAAPLRIYRKGEDEEGAELEAEYFEIEGYPLPFFPLVKELPLPPVQFLAKNPPNPHLLETKFPPIETVNFRRSYKLCGEVVNNGINLANRLSKVYYYMLDKYKHLPMRERLDFCANIVKEMELLLPYTNYEKDIETAETYIGWRGNHIGDANAASEVERFVRTFPGTGTL